MNKNLDYIKENYLIQLKSLNEYKTNIYFSILISTIFSLVSYFALIVISKNFSDILPWGNNEILFFTFFGGFIALFFGAFWFSGNLRYYILSGSLNAFLTKPVNVFIQYFFTSSVFFVLLTSLIHLVFLMYVIFFIFDIVYLDRLFYCFILGFLSGIFAIFIYQFFDSLAFFIKESNFLFHIYVQPQYVFDRFPAVMFKNWIKILSFFYAGAYIQSYSTAYYFGYISFSEVLNMYFYLIVLIIVFLILVYLVWKIGLKRYEAFG